MLIITVELDVDYEFSTNSLFINGSWFESDPENPVINNQKLKEVWIEYIEPAIKEFGEFHCGPLYVENGNGEEVETGFTNLTYFFKNLEAPDNVVLEVIEKSYIDFNYDENNPDIQLVPNSNFYIIDLQKTAENIKEEFQLDPEWIKNKFQVKHKK